MTEREYLQELEKALAGKVSEETLRSGIEYYRGCIEEQEAAGKTPEEIFGNLPAPETAARTLVIPEEISQEPGDNGEETSQSQVQGAGEAADVFFRTEEGGGEAAEASFRMAEDAGETLEASFQTAEDAEEVLFQDEQENTGFFRQMRESVEHSERFDKAHKKMSDSFQRIKDDARSSESFRKLGSGISSGFRKLWGNITSSSSYNDMLDGAESFPRLRALKENFEESEGFFSLHTLKSGSLLSRIMMILIILLGLWIVLKFMTKVVAYLFWPITIISLAVVVLEFFRKYILRR